ncbi:MAG: copper resistance protein CopC [Candidatus Nanopelagicales bacterium]|nr:copper resistance protein CopC [Candidatus Nanopelagicales bacterium]
MHRNIALAATAAMVFLLSVLMAPTGSAHADLQVSTPEGGESLEVAPEEIRLTFSEELFEELVEISILDAAGDLYSTIKVEQTPPPGTDVIFPWPPQAPPGEYSIAYRVVSADGHPVTGTISFSYAATAPQPSPSDTAPEPTPSDSTPSAESSTPSASPAAPSPTASSPSPSSATESSTSSSTDSSSGTPLVILGVVLLLGVIATSAIIARARQRN